MNYKHIFSVLLLGFISCSVASAQNLSVRPLQKLIDCPSAGGPENGSYEFELRSYPRGGVLVGFTVGIFKRFGVGLQYGGTGIIGFSDPQWNPQPGVSAFFRILNESISLPALTAGFNNQGYGYWDDDNNRYQFKAKGFYAVLGKNFAIAALGEMGWHLGANFNPIEEETETVDLFAAIDYHILKQIALIAEYSAALDDVRGNSLGEGRGYLNVGIRISFAERLALDVHLKDVLVNQKGQARGGEGIGREIRLSYVEKF